MEYRPIQSSIMNADLWNADLCNPSSMMECRPIQSQSSVMKCRSTYSPHNGMQTWTHKPLTWQWSMLECTPSKSGTLGAFSEPPSSLILFSCCSNSCRVSRNFLHASCASGSPILSMATSSWSSVVGVTYTLAAPWEFTQFHCYSPKKIDLSASLKTHIIISSCSQENSTTATHIQCTIFVANFITKLVNIS